MGMSNIDLLASGLKLLVFGMGMVYVFLVVMIFAINLMSILVKPFIARFEPSKPRAAAPAAAAPSDDGIIAAAVAAVALRRNR